MRFPFISFSIALFLDLVLGLVVYWANHKRVANQHFLTLSLTLAAWLICIGQAMTASRLGEAEFWIRQASATGVFIPTSFNLLRLAIVYRTKTWWQYNYSHGASFAVQFCAL